VTTYPRGALVLIDDFGGQPLDTQPDALDDREPPDGHYGLVVREAIGAGFAERRWAPTIVYPPRPRSLTKLDFLGLFTQGEVAAAMALKATTLAVFWLFYEAATTFERDDPRTLAGLDALVAAEVIDAERKADIIAGWPAF
jgi:hypothetical protein